MSGKSKEATAAESERTPLVRDVKARIDANLYRRLVEAAAKEDRSESAIMRRALRSYLDGVAA